jgi:hypothetical protein
MSMSMSMARGTKTMPLLSHSSPTLLFVLDRITLAPRAVRLFLVFFLRIRRAEVVFLYASARFGATVAKER